METMSDQKKWNFWSLPLSEQMSSQKESQNRDGKSFFFSSFFNSRDSQIL